MPPQSPPSPSMSSETLPTQPCPTQPRWTVTGASTTRLENLHAMVAAALQQRPTHKEDHLATTAQANLPQPPDMGNRWIVAARRVPGLQEALRNHLILLAADALTRGVPVPGLDDLNEAISVMRPHPLPHPRNPMAVIDDLLALYIARLKCGEIPYDAQKERASSDDDTQDWTMAAEHGSPGRAVFNREHCGEIIAKARSLVIAYAHLVPPRP
ncbi:hypothetical protein PYCCODRAFT_1428626 [Trametes coccinea BRFM310]|uniref:Uncharacterized protein n=1 Tax=Trametes coccinea (strain BRFM310) TaxID=1353009 RepID=A0A1Y2IBD6_TRAC3|nr:hypothetical protein PYCCODRAFT_1428626 [Trametes coccinea BRFM310]